jgi:hypothetical protein
VIADVAGGGEIRLRQALRRIRNRSGIAAIRVLQQPLERFDLQRPVTVAQRGFKNRAPLAGVRIARERRAGLGNDGLGRQRGAAKLQA